MSSHLNSFQESLSADEDEDVEFAAFDPEHDDSSPIADDEAAPTLSPPNWFKPKTDAPQPEQLATPDDADSLDFEFAPAPDAGTSTASTKTARPKTKSKVDKKQSPPAIPDRKRPSKSPKAAEEKVVETSEEDLEELKWHEHAIRWLKSGAAGGFGISLIFHFILLIALSFVIYSSMDDNEPISMVMSDVDGIPSELEESALLEMESSGGEINAMPEFKAVALEETQKSDMVDMASILGSGEGAGDDDGFTFSMPTGGRVSKKGSFAAWTVPKDPKPGQEYQIVIRIKLPKSSRKYRVDDLSGFVIGTDGFRLAIPFDRNKPDRTKAEKNGVLLPVEPRDYLRIVDSHVQLVVSVPGGASLVKDTIEVRSKKLKEEQKLEIEF